LVGGVVGMLAGGLSTLWDLITGKKPKEETPEKSAKKVKNEAKIPNIINTAKETKSENYLKRFSFVPEANATETPKTSTYNVSPYPVSKVLINEKTITHANLSHVINDVQQVSEVILKNPRVSLKDKIEVTKTMHNMTTANQKGDFKKVYSDIKTIELYKNKYASTALVHNVTQAKQEAKTQTFFERVSQKAENVARDVWSGVKSGATSIWNWGKNTVNSVGRALGLGGGAPIDLGTPLQPAKYAPIAGSQVEFVKKLYPDAVKASRATGFPVDFIIAQAGLETGWGRSVLKGTNNLFNIKAGPHWKGPVYAINALEYKNGIAYNDPSAFRVYGSYSQSIEDWVNFLRSNSRYSNLFNPDVVHNTKALAYYISKDGYATDPNYTYKLINTASVVKKIMLDNHLSDKGTTPIITSATGTPNVRKPIPQINQFTNPIPSSSANLVVQNYGRGNTATPVSKVEEQKNISTYHNIRAQQSVPKEQAKTESQKIINPTNVNNIRSSKVTSVNSNTQISKNDDYQDIHRYARVYRNSLK
jgi:flagellum-specific peptidoglycan hydrolase FlgJ